jgi:catalase
MLQGRIFSYPDTHRHRLGPNYHLLPVNSAKAAKSNNYQRDGLMRCDDNAGAGPNYYPNSFGGPNPYPEAAYPALKVFGKTGRHPYSHPNDDFVQPGELYRKVMSEQDRTHLIGNIVNHLGGAKKRIQLRQTALFYKVDTEYGSRVAQGLRLDLKEIKRLSGMTQEKRVKATSG